MATGKALGMLLAIVAVIGGFIALAALLGITQVWAGFLFLLGWSLMEGMKRERLPHAVLGAATGIAIAATPAWSAPLVGPAAAPLLLGVVALVATFLMLTGRMTLVVNPLAMLFLTVATIPAVAAGAPPTAMLLGLLAGAAYFGGLALLAGAIGKARGAVAAAPS